MDMAKKKAQPDVSRGRPLVGKKGFTVKFFPEFVQRIDDHIQENSGKGGSPTDRSSLIEKAVEQYLKRRDA